MTRFALSLFALLVATPATLLAQPAAAPATPKLNDVEIAALIKENERLKAENKRLRQAGTAGQASTSTAVVDLKRTYDSLKEKIIVEADFKTREDAFKAENDKREGKLKELQEAMKNLKAGSIEFVSLQEELEKLTGEYRVWITVETGKINRDRAAWLKLIYGKMLAAIDESALEKNYDLILFKAPTIDFTEVSSEQVPGMIQSRKVLWSIEEIDLTDLVIQKMNLAHDKALPRR